MMLIISRAIYAAMLSFRHVSGAITPRFKRLFYASFLAVAAACYACFAMPRHA